MKKITIILFLNVLFFNAFAKIDKVRLILLPNNTYVLAWNQLSGKSPIVCYDQASYFDSTNSFQLVAKAIKSNKAYGMHTFFAEFTSLLPDTKYYVSVYDSEGYNQKYWFCTFSDKPDTLSVIMGGDSRSHPEIRLLADKMVGNLQPDLVVFDGDFTSASISSQWQQWLDDWQSTIVNDRLIPLLIAEGNHERGDVLQKLFDTPENSFYSVSIGNLLHIVILNSQYDLEPQTQFLNDDLSQNQSIWKTVVYHKPMRPHYSSKPENNDIYDAWALPIHQNKVDMVLEGDTHLSKITYPIRPSNDSLSDQGFVRDDKDGTIYLGEGSWGAPLRPADDAKDWTMDMASINQFKMILFTPHKAEIKTVKYENANEVSPLAYNQRYTLPPNIDLWKPAGLDVVVVKK